MWVWVFAIYLVGMSATLALMHLEREAGRLPVSRGWLLVLACWPVVWLVVPLCQLMRWRAGK